MAAVGGCCNVVTACDAISLLQNTSIRSVLGSSLAAGWGFGLHPTEALGDGACTAPREVREAVVAAAGDAGAN